HPHRPWFRHRLENGLHVRFPCHHEPAAGADVDGLRLALPHGHRARLGEGDHVDQPVDLLHRAAEPYAEPAERLTRMVREFRRYGGLRSGSPARLGYDGSPQTDQEFGVKVSAAVLPLLLLACCIQPKPLEIYGQIPPFRLIDQNGRPFDSATLDGHIWVADFI